jgi:hypothetical protein
MNVYIFSGLGADKRAFNYLTFPTHLNIFHIDWIQPIKNEPIGDYAKRISSGIDAAKPFMLIGLSFGGMVCTEIAQFLKPQKVILISSVKNKIELPFYYRLVGLLKLNKLIPKSSSTKVNFITNWLFSTENNTDKALLKEIIGASNPTFTLWAINEIANWKQTCNDNSFIRIHGSKDRILPINNFKPNYLIENAGHLMIVNRAEVVSEVLKKVLCTKY